MWDLCLLSLRLPTPSQLCFMCLLATDQCVLRHSVFYSPREQPPAGSGSGGCLVEGLHATVEKRRAEKLDKTLEEKMRKWIESKVGPLAPGSLAAALKDGVALCKLANSIAPDAVKKINTQSNLPFKCMENIQSYLNACKEMGAFHLTPHAGLLSLSRCIRHVLISSAIRYA
jgi:hypothetical protein